MTDFVSCLRVLAQGFRAPAVVVSVATSLERAANLLKDVSQSDAFREADPRELTRCRGWPRLANRAACWLLTLAKHSTPPCRAGASIELEFALSVVLLHIEQSHKTLLLLPAASCVR